MKVIGKISQPPGVYKITCTQTGKFYVGSSVNCKRRKAEHLSEFTFSYGGVPSQHH